MKIEECLSMLERVRLMADDSVDSLDRDAVVLNIIHILTQYIGNPKIREKIDEIPF